jgi:hypothetical protein
MEAVIATTMDSKCGETQRLSLALSVAISDHTDAVQALRELSGATATEEYAQARKRVEKMGELEKQIRDEFDQHKAEHGC